MSSGALHVVFTEGAADELREALTKAGKNERVVASADDLSFGPIDPVDGVARQAWLNIEMEEIEWRYPTSAMEAFWSEALQAGSPTIAWYSRRSNTEFSNFLHWLWRYGHQPCVIVDLTDVEIERRLPDGRKMSPRPAISLHDVGTEAILAMRLFDRTEPLADTTRERYRALWKQLQAENAPLRIPNNGSLRSVPVTHLDALIWPAITDDWRKVARVVGDVMVKLSEAPIDEASPIVLAGRIRAFAKAGMIESQGNLRRMRFSEVRRRRLPD